MNNHLTLDTEDFHFIASPFSVRDRSRKIYDLALSGRTHFKVNKEKIPDCARFVLNLIKENYPTLEIPFHSRWEHFRVGGIDRVGQLNQLLKTLSAIDQAKAKFDLVIVSVLLDAGAGAKWSYKNTYTRSEGLAVASLDMFLKGLFSSNPANPLQVDAAGLERLKIEDLSQGFQISQDNPMTGLEGRFELLKKLGQSLVAKTEFFGAHNARPGNLVDRFHAMAKGQTLGADKILSTLLLSLESMWPQRLVINNINFGDAWIYKNLGPDTFSQIVCFHKLSQWLSYSLVEPLTESGLTITHVNRLTGLPEYRNGGLFLDKGVIELRDPTMASKVWPPHSDFIVEWRALTVTLLDEIAQVLRKELKMTDDSLPLGKVLQGGTWLAGRKTAAELRKGLPPFNIESDGTVF